MAARRLPWIKLWLESLDHEKVALLSDAQFRTWVRVLCKGSEQPTRWRFASAQHAAAVAGRPLQQVKQLIAARLLDQREDGVWVHDYKHWQERYDSDIPLNGSDQRSANAPPTLLEDSVESPPTLPRAPARAPADREVRPETGEERPETGEELPPPPAPPPAPNGAVAPASSRDAPLVLASLSEGARDVVETWRSAHGKRSPPKLNPTQQAKLERAVTEVGLDWLKVGVTWSAERGLPEFDKAINAAYTARENGGNRKANGAHRQRAGQTGQGSGAAAPGPGTLSNGEPDPFAKYYR